MKGFFSSADIARKNMEGLASAETGGTRGAIFKQVKTKQNPLAVFDTSQLTSPKDSRERAVQINLNF
jgi:hypothetical protein